jgi:teichuronic acid exporter
VPESLAYREMKFKWLAMLDLSAALLTSGTTLTLATLGYGVWSLVLGNLAGNTWRTLLLVRRSPIRPSIGAASIGHHIRFGGFVTGSRALWQFVSQCDILIAGRFLTQEAVGLYSVSVQLATLPMQKTMNILNQVTFLTVARLQDELPRLRSRLLHASRLLGLVMVPLMWGMSAVAPEFITVVLGSRWAGAVFALQIVTLVVPIRMLSAVFSTAVTGIGRADLDFRNTLTMSFVLPAAFLAGVKWGVDGLAFSWFIATPIIFALNFPRTARALGIKARDLIAALYVPLIAGTGMYFAVAGVRRALDGLSAIDRLVALIITGAITYLSTSLILDRNVSSEVKQFILGLRGSG